MLTLRDITVRLGGRIILDGASATEKTDLFSATAARVYRIDVPS